MQSQSTTIELDNSGFEELKNQITDGKSLKETIKESDIRDQPTTNLEKRNPPSASKKYVLKKGDQTFELDDDFELEMMADKKPIKLSLRELKDRAAGDIAVKNRMHSLAEEKKRVQSTLKEFASLAKDDPLGALEFISNKAKEADGDFEYNKYIEKLADQAESLGKMDQKDRESLELKKKLSKAEEDLSRKDREQAVVLRKQEMLTDYPQIGDREFGQMVNAVLQNETLLEGLEDEADVMDKVEELIQETLTQRDILTVIEEINPSYADDNKLIFSLSDQIRQNPDLDEEDIRDIIRELIPSKGRIPQKSSERERDAKILSNKQRQSTGTNQYREQNSDPFDLLKKQLLEKQSEFKKTPKYMR